MKANDSLQAIWKKIQDTAHSPGNYTPQSADELLQVLARLDDKHTYLAESWLHAKDTMPASRPRRGKSIHRAGTTATIEWVPVPDNGYTGLLRSGGIGLLRASLTTSGEHREAFTPGLAVKLFIDNQPSENVLAAYRFEGFQRNERDFFKKPLTTHVEPPVFRNRWIFRRIQWNAAVGLFKGALAWRDKTPKPPSVFRIPLEPFCARTSDGSLEPTVPAPTSLSFRVTSAARHAWRKAKAADFRDRFAQLPAQLDLYEVFDQDNKHVATLRTTSQFIASSYGDDTLFFQHAHQPKSDE